MRSLYFVISVFVCLLLIAAVSTGQEQSLLLPSNFPKPIYDLSSNPVTDEGFRLGRKLFYDGNLSSNGVVSCSFCHQQPSAFTHHGHDVSHGVNDRLGRRNAPPIVNAIWQRTFFWDGGVNHLEFVPVNAIENENEMDESVSHILEKLNQSTVYRQQFQEAFGTGEITTNLFLKALTQYTASLISSNSRYDRYIRHEGVELNEQELAGMKLFRSKCSTCHATDLFTDGSYRNNGITDDFRFDKGREEITLQLSDRGKFKVPTLRNIEFTDPYMHDGSVASLEEVLQHYATGIKISPTLDPILEKGISLSPNEQRQIITFLKTLTDEEFLHNKNFSEH